MCSSYSAAIRSTGPSETAKENSGEAQRTGSALRYLQQFTILNSRIVDACFGLSYNVGNSREQLP